MRRRNLLTSGGKDYSQEYFTIVAKSDGNIVFSGTTSGSTTNKLQYSTNNGSTWSAASRSITVSVTSGKKVMFKGTCTPVLEKGIGTFNNTTASFDVEGNAMSLLYGDNFSGQTSLARKNYAFYGLFSGCTTLQSAENLLLHATTLADYCYQYMFYNCSGLTTPPQLLATTLAYGCYIDMFWGCTSLTTAPELPATTLATYCYLYMFHGCTSLTTAPTLPATKLAEGCYYGIFEYCTHLITAPKLSVTVLAQACYTNMFKGCTSLTTAPTLPATTLKSSCYAQMFLGCTSLTTAPTLPATTLTYYCYDYMFKGCSNLSSITCLATDISSDYCTTNWVDGVAATGTFTKASSMSSWTRGVDGIPSGWTVRNA